MTLDEARNQLLEYLYDELDALRRGELESLLAVEPSLREELDQLEATLAGYRTVPVPPKPADTAALVLAARRVERLSTTETRSILFHPGWAAAALLMICAGVYVFLPENEPVLPMQEGPVSPRSLNRDTLERGKKTNSRSLQIEETEAEEDMALGRSLADTVVLENVKGEVSEDSDSRAKEEGVWSHRAEARRSGAQKAAARPVVDAKKMTVSLDSAKRAFKPKAPALPGILEAEPSEGIVTPAPVPAERAPLPESSPPPRRVNSIGDETSVGKGGAQAQSAPTKNLGVASELMRKDMEFKAKKADKALLEIGSSRPEKESKHQASSLTLPEIERLVRDNRFAEALEAIEIRLARSPDCVEVEALRLKEKVLKALGRISEATAVSKLADRIESDTAAEAGEKHP